MVEPLDFGIVDSHVHLWDPKRLDHPWLAQLPDLRRPFLPEDHAAALGAHALEALVFVECDAAPGAARAELEFVEALARDEPRLRAIVAHAPLEQGDAVRPELEHLAARPLVRGVRRLLQGESDPAFCLREDFAHGVRALGALELHFEICVSTLPQLDAAAELARRCPDVRFVLDHCGKPDIATGALDPWREHLRELARLDNVWCKLSGLVSEAGPDWTPADLAPFVAHALDCFGPTRTMFGGDWPVLLGASSLERWLDAALELCTQLSDDERRAVFRDTALGFYRMAGPVL